MTTTETQAREGASARLPPRAQALVAAVLLGALGVVLSIDRFLPTGDLAFYSLLILAALLSTIRPVHLFYGSTTDVSTAILMTTLVLYGPGPASLAAVASKLLKGVVLRWSPIRTGFNAAQYILSIGLAAALLDLARARGLEPAGIVAAPLGYVLINIGLVTAILAFSRGLSLQQVWRENFRGIFAPLMSLAMLGAMVGFSITKEIWQFGLLILIMVSGYLTFRLSWLLRHTTEEARHLQILNRTMAGLTAGPDAEPDHRGVLQGAAEIVEAHAGSITVEGMTHHLRQGVSQEMLFEGVPDQACRGVGVEASAGPIFTDLPAGSFVCIPLTIHGRRVGCINLRSHLRLSQERLRPILTSLSQQVSNLLEKVELYAQERQRAQALRALMETVRQIHAQLSLRPMLQLIVQTAAGVFDADVGCIYLLDREGSHLELTAATGLPEEGTLRQRLSAAELAPAFPSPHQQPAFLTVDLADASNGAADMFRATGLGMALVLPLWHGEWLMGLLCVATDDASHSFSQAEIELALALASAASIAVRNASLYEALEEKEEHLRSFLERLIRAQEEERKMVAYDIHDGLLQYVIAAQMHLMSFDPQELADLPQEAADLQMGLERLASAIHEGRRIISDLRPSTLDDFGLADTVERHLALLGREQGWTVAFRERIRNLALPSAVETTAFRIVQEALNNVQKHAQASRVEVDLEWRGGELHIRVRDWGRGFDPDNVTPSGGGFGLSAIRERADLMSGWSRIESRAGEGTTIEVGLPIYDRGDGGRGDGSRDGANGSRNAHEDGREALTT